MQCASQLLFNVTVNGRVPSLSPLVGLLIPLHGCRALLAGTNPGNLTDPCGWAPRALESVANTHCGLLSSPAWSALHPHGGSQKRTNCICTFGKRGCHLNKRPVTLTWLQAPAAKPAGFSVAASPHRVWRTRSCRPCSQSEMAGPLEESRQSTCPAC